MISRKTRRGIMAMVLLTGISFWATREQREDDIGPVTGLDPKLNYVLRNFELQVFDQNGNATLNLKAPTLSNNPLLKMGRIENPTLVLHQQDITWNMTADSATITADKEHVELLGKVYVHRFETATARRVELNTSELKIEVVPQTASTAAPISLFDGSNHMNAVGMTLDMMSDTFTLKQQVEAIYAIN
jgi:LPS export ABC transporter protein LptC